MKRLVIIFGVIILLLGIVIGYFLTRPKILTNNYKPTKADPLPQVTSSQPENYVAPEALNSEYKTNWLILRDTNKIKLYSNLDDQLSSSEIIDKKLCSYLVNASFYNKENKPIGLFIANGETLNPSQNNTLFNGYFYIDNNKGYISYTPPADAQIAVQSGPVFIKDNSPQKISTGNAEHDRRIIAAILDDGNLAFLVIYDKKSPFKGPALSEVPQILQKLESNSSLNFKDAMNLDGGSASVFITDETRLTELTRIGSYFCISQ